MHLWKLTAVQRKENWSSCFTFFFFFHSLVLFFLAWDPSALYWVYIFRPANCCLQQRMQSLRNCEEVKCTQKVAEQGNNQNKFSLLVCDCFWKGSMSFKCRVGYINIKVRDYTLFLNHCLTKCEVWHPKNLLLCWCKLCFQIGQRWNPSLWVLVSLVNMRQSSWEMKLPPPEFSLESGVNEHDRHDVRCWVKDRCIKCRCTIGVNSSYICILCIFWSSPYEKTVRVFKLS